MPEAWGGNARRSLGATGISRAEGRPSPKTKRAAEPNEGERAVSSPTRRRPTAIDPRPASSRQAAEKVQALSKALSTPVGSSGLGVPRIAIPAATPKAAPTWRATEFSPVAVANASPGAEATAVPLRLG